MRSQTERMYFIAEKILVVGAFLYFMAAIIPLLRNPDHMSLEIQASDSLLLLLQVVIYAGAMIFIIPNRGRLLKVFAQNPVLCCFLLLILFSTIWSAVPLFTLRRAVGFMLTTGFGLYCGTRFETKEQMRLVAYALAVCVMLSVVFIVALPRYGCDAMYNGAWRGVFIHKNLLGGYMVVATFTFLCFHAESILELVVKYLCLALSVCLVIGSEAKGSYVVLLVSILLIVLYRLLHLHWKRLIPAAVVALTVLAVAAVYVASNADVFLRALGKNATLTGRTQLWTTVLAISSGNRWLGYGFVGFWATNSHSVWSIVGWMPHTAHNGFIDLLLELGLLGLGIFALNTAIAIWRSMKLVARERTLESQWPLLMLSLILLSNVFESNLTLPIGFMWIAYVAITVSAQRAWSVSRATVRTAAPMATQCSAPEYELCSQ
jgi:exopolysaccharide production protein ExoQ